MGLPHVLIIPGAWITPASYQPLITVLQGRGYGVSCPQMATCGPHYATGTFVEDVAIVEAELKSLVEKGLDIVVIMHSYGGIVGAEALRGFDKASQSKGGVTSILFLGTFMPGPNQSLPDIMGGGLPPYVQHKEDPEV
jgi:pimeloyl-ACP methyl ester carboxylesterase